MELIIDQYRGAVADQFAEITSQFIFEEAIAHSFDSCVIMLSHSHIPIVYVNQAFCQMTGYLFEDVLGGSLNLLSGPKTNFGLYRFLNDEHSNKDMISGETFCYRSNNDEFHMKWRIIPFRNEQGIVSHFLMIMQDITEQRLRQN